MSGFLFIYLYGLIGLLGLFALAIQSLKSLKSVDIKGHTETTEITENQWVPILFIKNLRIKELHAPILLNSLEIMATDLWDS